MWSRLFLVGVGWRCSLWGGSPACFCGALSAGYPMLFSAHLAPGFARYWGRFASDAEAGGYAVVSPLLYGLANGFLALRALAPEPLIFLTFYGRGVLVGWTWLSWLGLRWGVFGFRFALGPWDNVAFLGETLSGPCSAALLPLDYTVCLVAVRAECLAFDGLIGAVPAKAEFVAPLECLGGAYAFEFLVLVWCELWLLGVGGFSAFEGGVRLFLVRVGDFGLSGPGVAGVGRHGEYEDVLEGTAYWPRVRGNPKEIRIP